MKRAIITTLAISISALSAIAEAQVYKWKDNKGQIHYASAPPKPSEKSFDLEKGLIFSSKATTASPNKVETKTENEHKKTNDESSTLKEPSQQKLTFCAKERKKLALLTKNTNVTWIENGKEIPLSGKLLEEKILLTEKSIQTNCTAKIVKEEDKK
ncbi:MAG: hypothetical protein DSZ29_00575 [Aquificaceae bacterium]|nr:MAG: hypothetical protein DSZ29_00575 [Aquificaceae bacterium]